MSIDSIGNFLTIIRNGIMASKYEVIIPYSRLKHQIVQILKNEGFINSFFVSDTEKKELKVVLRYVGGESAIHEITRKSRPGRRLYVSATHIEPVIGGLGVSILTTNKGIMTNKQAKDLSIGGEVICAVW